MRPVLALVLVTGLLAVSTAGCFRSLGSASRPPCESDSDCPPGQGCDLSGACLCDPGYCEGCCAGDGTCREGLTDGRATLTPARADR